MAPTKRRRTIDDDGEDEREDNSSELSDSPPPAQRNKAIKACHAQTRPRSSADTEQKRKSHAIRAHENGGSAVSDDDSAQDDGQDGPITDDDEDEDALEAEMMEQMMEDSKSKKVPGSLNQAAEHGVIEEVYCQNFMCHSKLRVKLGPLINFIIGHNGSGKSAVLTALTLCLGAKATVTNRGGSLKKFIKEGSESCMLSVKIKNQGGSAYQHDLYGDTIIVERHFSRSGSSGFKLKSAEGRIITTKKSDLEDMLDCMSLQLDNPMSVLSQDLARQFLSNSSRHEKYKFFLKGTQLEQLDRDYRTMHEYIDSSEAKLETRQEDLSHLLARLKKAEAKKREVEQAETISEKIREMERMHAWAQVEEQEREQQRAGEAVAAAAENLTQKQRDGDEKTDAYAEKNDLFEAARSLKTDFQDQLLPAVQARDEIKDEFDKNRDLLLENGSTRRNIRVDLKTAQEAVTRAEREIRKEEERIRQASGPAQAEKLEELRGAEEELEQRQAELEQNSDRSALDNEKAAAEKAKEDKERAMNSLKRSLQDDIQAAERRLQDLRKEQGGMGAYHHSLRTLLSAIQNERGFKERPVGPAGMHVKLKDAKWSSIIESTFGQVLNAFVVTNAHDQGILRGLMSRTSYNGDIYIGSPRPLDITPNKANTNEYPTLLDVLDVEHDIIRNQFIINQAAEKTVLIEDRNTASQFNLRRIRNVAAVLTIDANKRGAGSRFSMSQNGPRMDPVQPWRGAPRMQTNIDAQIATQKANIEDAKRQMQECDEEVAKVVAELRQVNQAVNRFSTQLRNLRIAKQEAEARVEQIKQELEAYTIDGGTLDAHKNALAEAKGDVEVASNSYQDAIVEKDRLNEANKDVKARMDEAQKVVDECQAKLEKCTVSIRKKEVARGDALMAKNAALAKVEDARQRKAQADAALAELDARVENYIEEASKICARIEVREGMTPERLEKKIQKLEREQQDAERRLGGTREEVHAQWKKADDEYKAANAGAASLKALVKMLKNTYEKRKETWKTFRRYIMTRAKIMFTLLLLERKFKGRLIADHEQRILDIMVEPDMTKSSNQGRQTKTLSGGEKSFSTICLLLSIWEAMGSPIRCLDEFDVFMDNVNRDTSMKMMIDAARGAVGKQYILITPQAMNNIPIEEDMRIHKMSDPERGQTALPFGS